MRWSCIFCLVGCKTCLVFSPPGLDLDSFWSFFWHFFFGLVCEAFVRSTWAKWAAFDNKRIALLIQTQLSTGSKWLFSIVVCVACLFTLWQTQRKVSWILLACVLQPWLLFCWCMWRSSGCWDCCWVLSASLHSISSLWFWRSSLFLSLDSWHQSSFFRAA